MNSKYTLSMMLTGTLLSACGSGQTQTPGVEDATITSCTGDGKCDSGGADIKKALRDPKDINLSDLAQIGADYIPDSVNQKLINTDYGSIAIGGKFDPASVFGIPGAATGVTVQDINQLSTDLAARFGSDQLATQANQARASYLQSNGGVFAESDFTLSADVGLSHSVPLQAFKIGAANAASISIGFDIGKSVQAKVVGAYNSQIGSLLQSPLAALYAERKFVMPTSVNDIKSMKPGESISLNGSGTIGFNMGLDVPLLASNPTSFLTYDLVFSANGSVTVKSDHVDVQTLRLADEVVVDVGVQNVTGYDWELALHDSWGVQNLVSAVVNLGAAGNVLHVDKLASHALQSILNDKFSLVSASVSGGQSNSRLSLTRIRFAVSSLDDATVQAALIQAMQGHLQLAQAAAAKGIAGVTTDFDFSRTGMEKPSYAGIEILGMKFFTQTDSNTVGATIQTADGVRTIAANSFSSQSGAFQDTHGYTRVGLSSLNYDRASNTVKGEANLLLSTTEAAAHISKLAVFRNISGVLGSAIGGEYAANIMSPAINLQTYVDTQCSSCTVDQVLAGTDANTGLTVTQMRQAINDGVTTALAKGVDAQLDKAQLIESAAALLTDAALLPQGRWFSTQATGSIKYNTRLDDTALNTIMSQGYSYFNQQTNTTTTGDGAQYLAGRINYWMVTNGFDSNNPASQAVEQSIGGLLSSAGQNYRAKLGLEQNGAITDASGANISTDKMLQVAYQQDPSHSDDYINVTTHSLAQERVNIVTNMFDSMMKLSSNLISGWFTATPNPEQPLVYALAELPAQFTMNAGGGPAGGPTGANADTELSFDIQLDDGFLYNPGDYRQLGFHNLDATGIGSAVDLIGGGQFNVDSILNPANDASAAKVGTSN